MILLFIISAYDVLINKRQIAFFSSFPSVALKAQEHLATSVFLSRSTFIYKTVVSLFRVLSVKFNALSPAFHEPVNSTAATSSGQGSTLVVECVVHFIHSRKSTTAKLIFHLREEVEVAR